MESHEGHEGCESHEARESNEGSAHEICEEKPSKKWWS